jgi:hypothetical protein
MTKRTYVIAAVVAVALVAGGGLFASNMGFKLNYNLADTGDPVPGGTSKDGTNTVGLPFNAQTGLTTAAALFNDIGSSRVQNIQKYIQSTGGIQLYNAGGTDFNLAKAEGYFVKILATQGTNYVVVGSHDPTFTVSLAGTGQAVPGGTSKDGTNFYSYPYHSTTNTASTLANDIGSTNVLNVQRFIESTNGLDLFIVGTTAPPGFSLVPGESYFIKIKSGVTVSYVPSHY